MIYYRKLDEVRKWGCLRYLIERLCDGKIATVKPSWVKSYGLQDERGLLYMAASPMEWVIADFFDARVFPRALTEVELCRTYHNGQQEIARRDIPQWNELPYVTDGLIAMWDGEWNAGVRAHDPEATTWKDLVGDADIILNDGKSWIVNSNNIEIDGSQSSIGSLADSVPDGQAVEVILYNKAQSTSFPTLICFNSGGFRVAVCSDNRGLNFLRGKRSAAKVTGIFDGATAVSVNLDADLAVRATYENGEYLGESTPEVYFADTSPGFVLATWNSSSRFKGNVYCIRVYNRNLSAEEIAQNHTIDKARFGL